MNESHNLLTAWLADRFPEEEPAAFYRELFPEGSLTGAIRRGCPGYAGIVVRLLHEPGKPDRADRKAVTDSHKELSVVLALDPLLDGGVTDLMSPVSYAGRRPLVSAAHELFALVFDLDGLRMRDGRPDGIDDLFYQMEDLPERPALLPTPTYTVSSGSGLHLYYLLDEPIRMWPNTVEALGVFRNAFTKRCWNKYVTDLSKEPQLESVVQPFRMVGTRSKDGMQTVRAFRTGGRVSVAHMNGFVPEDARIAPSVLRAEHTLEEARRLWPDWDPEWRRRAAEPPERPWAVKRDLYDWWCRRVEDGECFQGNRYWCIFVAACYAAKCPEVTYEELEAWAHRMRPQLDRLTRTEDNHFTDEDVERAIAAYGNPLSVKLRRDKVQEKTQLPMPVNKRNGRKQEVHMAVMRAVQSVEDPQGNWRNKLGAPTKADLVLRYAEEHPGMSNRKIAEALGVSRNTVNKWLKVRR